VHYALKQKLVSFGTNFTIEGEDGSKYEVKGEPIALLDKISIEDADGNELVHIELTIERWRGVYEIHRSGRPVTLAVGGHVRVPRTYRGKDILWWMDAAGLLDERYDEVPDLVRARNLPSMQLVGSPDRTTVDLNSLSQAGVQLVGRLAGIRDGIAQFSGSLPNMCTLADLKLERLLDTIDAWATKAGWDNADPPRRFAPTTVAAAPPLTLDLRSGAIRTILWATGFRPDLSWLDVGVFDRKGNVRHDGGVTASPGLYLIGMPFLRRRKSTLIDGAAADAADLSRHLAHYLDCN